MRPESGHPLNTANFPSQSSNNSALRFSKSTDSTANIMGIHQKEKVFQTLQRWESLLEDMERNRY